MLRYNIVAPSRKMKGTICYHHCQFVCEKSRHCCFQLPVTIDMLYVCAGFGAMQSLYVFPIEHNTP